MTTSETTLLTRAHRQHMVVARPQLLDDGITDTDIARFRRRGLLVRTPVSGVYGVGRPPEGREGHLMAATLSVHGSALYRTAAAWALGFPMAASTTGSKLEIVSHYGAASETPWADVHRTRHLPPIDLTSRGPFPTTTVARTFCDLAAVSGFARMRHLGQQLLVRRDCSLEDLFGCAAGFIRRGRSGSKLLRKVLAAIDDGEPIPDSVLEILFIERVVIPSCLGLDRHVRPPWYDGWRGTVDFASLLAQLIVEVDGRSWHQIAQDMQRDRLRDRLAARHGFLTLRFTAAEIRRDPDSVADEIIFHLARRAA